MTKAWKYTKAQDIKVGYDNYNKIFKKLIDFGYLESKGYNKGYILAKPIEVLKNDFENNIVMASSMRVIKNSVTIRIINKICEWIRDIEQTKKKNVF